MKLKQVKITALLGLTVALWITGSTLAGIPAGLVGHWALDDMTGEAPEDSSGNENPGEFNGEPTWAEGYYDGALTFSDSSDGVIIPFSEMSVDQGTIAFWAYLDAEQENDTRYMFGHTTEPSYSDRIQIYMDGSTNELDLGMGGTHALDTDIVELETETWYHICLMWSSSRYTLYLDGEEIENGSISNLSEIADTADFGNNGSSGHDQGFDGLMDDVWIFKQSLTAKELAFVMAGGEEPGKASNPSPVNDEEDVALDASLSWKAGLYAVSHDVYFGTSFDDVNDASRANPGTALVSEGQSGVTYSPDDLVLDGEYYWRVDEVNADPSTIFKGPIWTFTAEPTLFTSVPVEATASSTRGEGYDPNNTINESGLNEQDQHSVEETTMWQTAEGDIVGSWIQYEFEQPQTLNQILIWNANPTYETFLGVGMQEATIETSLDGETWTDLAGTLTFNRATGMPDYTANTTVDCGNVVAQYVKITCVSQYSNTPMVTTTGLSEVRFLTVPMAARRPDPATGETVAGIFDTLTWRSGRDAVQHTLYLDMDQALVTNSDSSVLIETVDQRSYDLGNIDLTYGATYFWKVVETAGELVTDGPVWDFNTPDYLVIDDMESYSKNVYIFEAWVDGLEDEDETNGSIVGLDDPPYVEEGITFDDSEQSMPFNYKNKGKATSSTATMDLGGQNWVAGGLTTLVLFIKGDYENDGGSFFVEIDGKRVDCPYSLELPLWKQFNIELNTLGIDLTSVDSMTLGVDDTGAEGTIYIDEIRVYMEASDVVEASDPGDTGLVLYYDMEGDIDDSSGSGIHGETEELELYEDSVGDLYGESLEFDGLYFEVNIPDLGGLVASLDEDSSFASWFKIDQEATGSWMRVFDFGTGTDNYMFISPRTGTGGEVRAAILTPDYDSEFGITSGSVLSEGWHHVAMTFEQDDPNSWMTLYVDGWPVDTVETEILPSDLGETNQNWLGVSQWEDDDLFMGLMDEFRIYNRTLSEGEVRYLAGDR